MTEDSLSARENRRGLERAREDYQREDTRWESASAARDWAILVVIGILHVGWMLLVYLLEPGIR